jgi:DNA-directed RNA polymerase subunit beta'
MLSMNNIIMPKDGSPAITPTKDMPLGIYYLTIVKKNELGEGMIFSTFGEMLNALQNKCITIHSIVGISSNAFLNKTSVKKNEIIVATAGRFIFNNVLPKDFALVKTIMNIPMGEDARKTISQINVSKLESGITKSEIGKIINQIYAKYDNIITSKISDEIKNLGFKYGTKSGTTFSIFDFPKYTEKNSYIGEGIKKVLVLRDQCEEGLLTDDERYTRVVDV